MEPKQYKPRALREKNVEELTKSVASLRKELASLKVSKVASGVASKLAKIRVSFLFFSRTSGLRGLLHGLIIESTYQNSAFHRTVLMWLLKRV